MTDLGWPGVAIRDVLNAFPNIYEEYRKGLHWAHEVVHWRAEFYKLRDAQPRQLLEAESVEIFGQVQDTLAEVDQWRSEVSRARVDLSKLCSELEAYRNANLALRRDLKAS